MNALLGIALILAAADSNPVDVTVSLNPPVIPFHHQAKYTISVEAPNDVDVKFPQMVDKLGGLASSDLQRETTPLKNNRRRISETYTLEAIRAGAYKIYPAEVSWGENERLAVPSPVLRVRDLTDEEKKEVETFEDIAEPMPVKGFVEKHRAALIAAIAILALIGAGVWFARMRMLKRVKAAPPTPPWDVAYERLRELDERQLTKQGEYEMFYVELSSILRHYIEDRFSLRAPEQTTPEFIATASGARIFSDEQQKLLWQFMRHTDNVKFAQYVPTTNEMEHCFAFVLQFVDDTVPKLEPDKAPEEESERGAA